MIQQNQQVIESSQDYQQSLILNPLQYFICQLKTKDLKTKKTTIQNVNLIALIMTQQDTVYQLLPYLTKMLIQQTVKDVKVIIVRAIGKITNLLSQQTSIASIVQLLIDVSLIYQEIQIRNQAFIILQQLLFSQRKYIQFNCFKKSFENLIFNQFTSITDLSILKNAKQISIYLIKYLMINLKVDNKQEQVKIIQHLKDKYLFQTKDQYNSLKLLSQKLNILIIQWPQNLITQLQAFMQILSFKSKQSNQQNPTKQEIPKQVETYIKTNFINIVLEYGKKVNINKAYCYLIDIIRDQSIKVKISIIKKLKPILQLFCDYELQEFLKIFRQFTQQPHQVKKEIMEIINEIPFSQQQKSQLIIKHSKNSNQLKNILINSLTINNKSTCLSKLISECDYDFKVKIFSKLSDSMLHNTSLYSQIIQLLLIEPKKSFRSKYNLLQNLITRIEQNKKVHKDLKHYFNLQYLITMLLRFLGDKTALVRITVAKLSAIIVFQYGVAFNQIQSPLTQSFYNKDKTWFQRQNVLIFVKEFLQLWKNSRQISLKQVNAEFSLFIIKVLKDSVDGWQCRDFQKPIRIKNISSLSEQLLKKYGSVL